MHPDRLSDWEEDGIFFEENLCHHFFMFLRFPYAAVLRQCGSYATLSRVHQISFLKEHKKAIQKIAYCRGYCNVSYLSKEVVSHEMVPDLLKAYPDARFVITVRKSAEFLSSLIMLARASTMSKNGGYDPSSDPHWQPLIVERMAQDCELLVQLCRDVIPHESQYRLPAVQLFSNIESTIRDIYEWLSISIDEDYSAHLLSLSSIQSTRERGYAYVEEHFDGFASYDQFVDSIISAYCPEKE